MTNDATTGWVDRQDSENVNPKLDLSFSRKTSRRPPLLNLSDAGGPSVQICNRSKHSQKNDDEAETGVGQGWAATSRRGKRRPNREDAFAAHPCYIRTPLDDEPLSLFCVFDGHGGDRASKYARVRLPLLFSEYLQDDECAEIVPALEKAFLTIHTELIELNNPGLTVMRSKGDAPDAPEAPDQNKNALLRSWTAVPGNNPGTCDGEAECGTTATAVVIGRGEVTVVHVGDSRAIGAVGADANPTRLCDDHRPAREDEIERVMAAGGVILRVGGAERVNGVLAITRSLGHDGELGQLVIPNPEATCHELDELGLLIIGSDGVWDSLCDADALQKAQKGMQNDGPRGAVEEVSEAAIKGGATDDITVLVIDMSHYGGIKLLEPKLKLPDAFGDDDFDDESFTSIGDRDRESMFDGNDRPMRARSSSSVTGTPRHGARKMMW